MVLSDFMLKMKVWSREHELHSYFIRVMVSSDTKQGRNQEELRGLNPSLSQVKVKKKDKISNTFDLLCVSVT